MTWSIVAMEPGTGALGVAVASRFFAVGALVPHVRPGAGAVATQAFVNPLYGPSLLDRLAAGADPAAAVAAVTGADAGRANRQVHCVAPDGRTAAHTGERCVDWAGHVAGPGISVAGNMLAGPQVVAATLAAWEAAADQPFPDRLLTAMEAGEAAGGDRRGRQSAALRIHRGEDWPWLDIRADDHADPLAELRRLLAVARERFHIMLPTLPTRANPHGMLDRTAIDAEIRAAEQARIASGRPSASFGTPLAPD